ncbi:MAG: hypothetical protein NTV79_02475 [Candidatus Aureabacteria bacterium]|nr:hypothetical protein [Candidatus Auribacterota bacterium]
MDPILEFKDVCIEPRPPYDTGLEGASFAIAPGELLLVEVEKGHGRNPLADVAEGLVDPDRGAVFFRGREWAAMTAGESAENRGRIGRVFESGGWLSNLNIDENATLSQRHHTVRPVEEIGAEAEGLARAFGLSELPKIRPAVAKRPERRAAEWVRAFIGEPSLIILEHPMSEAYNASFPALAAAAAAATRRGAGVLWLTYDPLPPEAGLSPPPAGITPARVAKLAGNRLIPRT